MFLLGGNTAAVGVVISNYIRDQVLSYSNVLKNSTVGGSFGMRKFEDD